MNRWTRALAAVCAAISAMSVGGAALSVAQEPRAETSADTWYFLARATAILIAAVVASVGVLQKKSWAPPWASVVAVITIVTQLLDVPVWLLVRREPLLAVVALGLAVGVSALALRARRVERPG
jgi:hypothetical protein